MAKCKEGSGCSVCYPTPKVHQPPEAPPPPVYDEQLLLLGGNGKSVPHLPYSILLSDGSRRSGVTDGDGNTERVITYRPAEILTVTLTPPVAAGSEACCAADDACMSTERIYIDSRSSPIAVTNDAGVGKSVVKVLLPEGKVRGLSSSEIAMARTVFGDGVDYAKVKVHHGGWWLFSAVGGQDKTTAVTPNGEMYYPSAIYRDNFAGDDDRGRALFMHEMVHVWQKQMGYSVKLHGMTVTSRGDAAYRYTLTSTSRLSDFNMEQQGNIMSDYYMICIRRNPARAFNPSVNPELLHRVMTPFVNPRDKGHLPGYATGHTLT
ncbi:hypothetical protein [Dyella sp. C11]|uniref:hypothetical protein n=1 Tax=Dyella sp. C11 TaxID=2126991 RepID=UPI0013005474|nr:hypothetical protein [Dyella sp. C11]